MNNRLNKFATNLVRVCNAIMQRYWKPTRGWAAKPYLVAHCLGDAARRAKGGGKRIDRPLIATPRVLDTDLSLHRPHRASSGFFCRGNRRVQWVDTPGRPPLETRQELTALHLQQRDLGDCLARCAFQTLALSLFPTRVTAACE